MVESGIFCNSHRQRDGNGRRICSDNATDVIINQDVVRVPTDTIYLESKKHFVEYVLRTN